MFAGMLLVLFLSGAAFAEAPLLRAVPLGTVPTLDGTLSDGEWNDALLLSVAEDVVAYLKHAEGSVYLGIRGTPYGVGSPCIAVGDVIHVLHSSGSLGTAVYTNIEGTWSLSRPFIWECSYSSLTTTAENCLSSYLEENGWRAPNGRMGESTDFEFEILVDGDELSMLFLFLNVEPEMHVVSWPADVATSHDYLELARGNLPAEMTFQLSDWLTLQLANGE